MVQGNMIRNIGTVVIVIVIIIAAYVFLVKDRSGESSALRTSITQPTDSQLLSGEKSIALDTQDANIREISAILSELKTITLSGAIFSDPDFRSLVDYHPYIPPQTQGRTNPFSPTEGGVNLFPNKQ